MAELGCDLPGRDALHAEPARDGVAEAVGLDLVVETSALASAPPGVADRAHRRPVIEDHAILRTDRLADEFEKIAGQTHRRAMLLGLLTPGRVQLNDSSRDVDLRPSEIQDRIGARPGRRHPKMKSRTWGAPASSRATISSTSSGRPFGGASLTTTI